MTKRAARSIEIRLELQLLDAEAKNGRYQIVSDGKVFALARWKEGEFAYPGGEPIEFPVTHYRPASRLVKPEVFDGEG